jgi:hypothetical protein
MFGRISSGALRAAGQMTLKADAKGAAAHGTVRSITGLTLADSVPERILRVPIFEAGRSGLARLGVARHELLANKSSFRQGVARLNREFSGDPGRVARCLLTREEVLGATLGVLQAAHHLGENVESPRVLSLVFHLLSSLPLDARERAALEQHAQRIADEIAVDWITDLPSLRWWDRSPDDRERLLAGLADRVPAWTRDAGAATDTGRSMKLRFAPLHPCAAAMSPEEGGTLFLSEALRSGHPSREPALARRQEQGLWLLPANIGHEKVHPPQYDKAQRLQAGEPQDAREFSTAVGDAMSLGLQESLRELDPRGQAFSDLLPALPHERLAWSLAALTNRALVRALERHPAVPRAVADGLTDFLTDTYSRYAHLMGDRFVAGPLAPDGVLRAEDAPVLSSPGLSAADISRRAQAFIENPLPD